MGGSYSVPTLPVDPIRLSCPLCAQPRRAWRRLCSTCPCRQWAATYPTLVRFASTHVNLHPMPTAKAAGRLVSCCLYYEPHYLVPPSLQPPPGYFCVASGLGLGCGIQLGTLDSWEQLADLQVRQRQVLADGGFSWPAELSLHCCWLAAMRLLGLTLETELLAAFVLRLVDPWPWSRQVALRVLPTLGSTALLMLTMNRCKHPLALPGARRCTLCMPWGRFGSWNLVAA